LQKLIHSICSNVLESILMLKCLGCYFCRLMPFLGLLWFFFLALNFIILCFCLRYCIIHFVCAEFHRSSTYMLFSYVSRVVLCSCMVLDSYIAIRSLAIFLQFMIVVVLVYFLLLIHVCVPLYVACAVSEPIFLPMIVVDQPYVSCWNLDVFRLIMRLWFSRMHRHY